MGDRLTIGRLAQRVRVQPRTIRYYEQIGLLPHPRRTPAGYRIYSEQMVRQLALVRRLRLLGLSLAEVKTFTDALLDDSCTTFQHRLQAVLTEKIAAISHRIAELIDLRETLEVFAARDAAQEEVAQEENVLYCHDCHCLVAAEGGKTDGIHQEGDGEEANHGAARGHQGEGV